MNRGFPLICRAHTAPMRPHPVESPARHQYAHPAVETPILLLIHLVQAFVDGAHVNVALVDGPRVDRAHVHLVDVALVVVPLLLLVSLFLLVPLSSSLCLLVVVVVGVACSRGRRRQWGWSTGMTWLVSGHRWGW